MNYLISICITSYNRPEELKRCLFSIATNFASDIQILIGDDFSPTWARVKEVVNEYSLTNDIKTELVINSKNLGLDLNFHNLIKKSKGKYLLFITDDDAFLPGSIDKIIGVLRSTEISTAFAPYFNRAQNCYDRKYQKSFEIAPGKAGVEKYFYNSILLSGLIFKRELIPDYNPCLLKGLNYSQVFVFNCIIFRFGGAYLDLPLIDYIGDGRNGFGSNDGEEYNPLLADRIHYLSNLEYNKGLVKTIHLIDTQLGTDFYSSISKSYALRTISGLCYAKNFGNHALKEYKTAVNQVGFKVSILPDIYYYILRIFGLRLTKIGLNLGKMLYRSIRT